MASKMIVIPISQLFCSEHFSFLMKLMTLLKQGVDSSSRLSLAPSNHPDFTERIHMVNVIIIITLQLHINENNDNDYEHDLYIIGAVCLCVCLSQWSLFLYSKDLVVSPVSRHLPYIKCLETIERQNPLKKSYFKGF